MRVSPLKPHIPTGSLQSQLCALVCLSDINFPACEGGLFGEGVEMDRTDQRSCTRNYTKHKMQLKCKVSPLSN